MRNLNDEDNQEKKVDPLKKEDEKELSTEEKLKEVEEKLLRTLAELENQDIDKFLNNIEIIKKDLISIFKKNRIEKIDTKNKKFDPNFHQAMAEMEDEKVEPGTIVQEMLPGYMFGDRLLRPSLVAVSKKKAQNEVKKPEKSEKK